MKAINLISIVLLCSMLASCSDWLSEEGAPKLNYDYYKTEEGVNAAVIATYSYLRWGCGGERYDVLTEQGTDLFIAGSDGNYKASFNMYGTQLNPDIDVLNDLWENHYKGIGSANITMDNILNSELSEDGKATRLCPLWPNRMVPFGYNMIDPFGQNSIDHLAHLLL